VDLAALFYTDFINLDEETILERGWLPLIDLDLGELGSIKTFRALNDPLIVYESSEEWSPESDDRVYRDIRAARLQQNTETDLGERIEYSTWPEVVVYFSTLTTDEKYVTGSVKELYQFSFRRYLEEWLDDGREFPSPLSEEVDLGELERNRLDDLRFGIKKDRDRYFVENQYEEFSPNSVPKSFWLTEYELEYDLDSPDEMSQSALQDFLD